MNPFDLLEGFFSAEAGGLPALAAFVACLAVAGLAVAAIASLLLTSLKHLLPGAQPLAAMFRL